MENHPIPQDVTGFKFKLIGSVTVKQFLYLLGFGILTTVAFVLPVNVFLKIPMMLIFAGIGISLAFIPIEGRPMDIMLANFAKTIPSENRYLYRKRGVNLSSFSVFTQIPKKQIQSQSSAVSASSPQDEKKAILLSRLRNSPFRPDEGELAILANVKSFFEDSHVPLASTAVSLRRVPYGTRLRSQPGSFAPARLAEAPAKRAGAGAQSAPSAKVENKIEPEEKPFSTLPDVPNVILGLVHDSRGKSLQNILVEVIDSNGVPVRTFKTNAQGQFAAATQMQNGTYKVYFEDPQKTHEFEVVEINLNGEIFQPLEATSVDAREKLRRELFGGPISA